MATAPCRVLHRATAFFDIVSSRFSNIIFLLTVIMFQPTKVVFVISGRKTALFVAYRTSIYFVPSRKETILFYLNCLPPEMLIRSFLI
jgi:hypothetical protein